MLLTQPRRRRKLRELAESDGYEKVDDAPALSVRTHATASPMLAKTTAKPPLPTLSARRSSADSPSFWVSKPSMKCSTRP